MFLEILKRSWCYAFNGCKTQLHSDGVKELAKVVFAARTTSWKFSCLTHTTKMSSQRRWDPARNLGLVAGTQCVDRWWQSLEKALPQSLHIKDRPGGGTAEKLMSYVWAFVWRSNLGNHANLTKELVKIMWLGTNRASKWKNYFWEKWRLGESRTKTCKYQYKTNMCALKNTAIRYFHFHTKHKVL